MLVGSSEMDVERNDAHYYGGVIYRNTLENSKSGSKDKASVY